MWPNETGPATTTRKEKSTGHNLINHGLAVTARTLSLLAGKTYLLLGWRDYSLGLLNNPSQ